MIDQLGGRKAAALLVMAMLGVGAVLLKEDVPTNFLSLMEFLFGAFVVGNVGAKYAGGTSNVERDTAAVSVSDEAISARFDYLSGQLNTQEAALAASQEGIATIQQTLSFIIQKTGLNAK